MCRLFGFRSVIDSQVHSSLLNADNALGLQSIKHPDGWGVAYFIHNTPHIVKSSKSALDDNIFKKVSGIVTSKTVLAHIRKATLGQNNLLNTHPFQYGKWVFAHNGNIKDFDNVRDQILREIKPHLRKFVLGSTDSETIFYFILSFIIDEQTLDKDISIDVLAKACKKAIAELTKIVGPSSEIDQAGDKETYLTFVLTNGEAMIAHQGGKNLFYSTYKSLCPDRESCKSFAPECEAETKTGKINHLIFSSEPLSGENIWLPMKKGQLLGVDHHMSIKLFE